MNNILLTPNECEYIKSIWKDDFAIISDGNTYYDYDDGKILKIKTKTKSKYQYIDNIDFVNLILERLKNNGISTSTNIKLEIIKYNEGDFFPLHRDIDASTKKISKNKTVIIQLSNEDDYVGGDLIVMGKKQNRKIGSYSIFNGYEYHEVTPLIRGERYSLVTSLKLETSINNKFLI